MGLYPFGRMIRTLCHLGPTFFLFFLGACQPRSHSGPTQDKVLRRGPIAIGLKCTLPSLLRESSGLCYTDGNLWTFGDGGNPNEIYKTDSVTGAILQTVQVENFPNIDWEDITADSAFIYIGDFGNNCGSRTDLKIIRIAKSDLKNHQTTIKVKGEAIAFSYADQMDFSKKAITDYDCESVIWLKHFLYVFTKDGVDLKTRCYQIPDQPGQYRVSPISSFDSQGKITAAALDPVSGEIALLGYLNKKQGSFIWFLNGYPGHDLFGGKMTKIAIGTEEDWQTEGLDYISSKRLFMSCETSKSRAAALYFIQKND